MSQNIGKTIIRMSQLMDLTGLARATIYKLIRTDAGFPKQIRLTPSEGRGAAVGWDRAEVIAWIEQRMEQRTTTTTQNNQAQGRAHRIEQSGSIELRDLFAGLAMQSYLAHSDNPESNAKKAYAMADAMLVMRRLKI